MFIITSTGMLNIRLWSR